MANTKFQQYHCAFNFELPAGDTPPQRIELIPAGPWVIGRDGRKWLFDDQAAASVLAAFRDRQLLLPIDREHATQLVAPKGGEAPAAGWIESLSVDSGVLVGAVSWTPRGSDQITSREYRYISPVFDYDPDTLRIGRLVSAGLTNSPNLHLAALNREEETMKLSAAVAQALGLSGDATEDAGIAAINALKSQRDQALNAERTPSLDRYVPRADYDAVLQRATNAEANLKAKGQADHLAAVDSAIKGALQAGKIAPASADYYRATCTDAEGLERFRAFVSAAPVIAGESGIDAQRPPGDKQALNAETVADKARAYIAAQAAAGNEISVSQAVAHVAKEMKQ